MTTFFDGEESATDESGAPTGGDDATASNEESGEEASTAETPAAEGKAEAPAEGDNATTEGGAESSDEAPAA